MPDAARLVRLAAATALLAVLPHAAFADSFFCTLNVGSPGPPSWLCACTGTGGAGEWNPVIAQPDAAGAFPVNAASSGSAGGEFAASASANASAEPGLLRMEAEASAFGEGDAAASAGAQASMYEEGTFAPVGGAAPGTPITARLTIDVAGAFAGVPASADGDVDVYRGITLLAHRDLFLSSINGTRFEQIDLPGLVVGDTITLIMILRASANAADIGVTASSADLGNSARLFLDVTSGNASFEAGSGHDYTTVPEPGAALLALVGAGVLIGARGRLRG
jgi:hypothetical protein